jgi:GT2 family glycosyltransferase
MEGDELTVALPSVAIVICVYTFDRWEDILAAVASAQAQRVPADEIVVVVDHAPELFSRLAAELTGVTLVENRRQQGLSGARNTGVEFTSAEIVAFLDDDAIADPDWLGALRRAYTRDTIAGVGGMTLPRWDNQRPNWFPAEFDWTVGCSFTGREPGRVRNLLGGNASFRRAVFDVAGGFPENMGRNAAHKRPLGAEETELCIRATQLRPDWEFIYEPHAVIWHRVPADRERFRYFRSRCHAEGISKAAVVHRLGASDGLSAERSYVVRTLSRGVVRGFGDAVRGDHTGLGRSFAIMTGLLLTGCGYIRGRLSLLAQRSAG